MVRILHFGLSENMGGIEAYLRNLVLNSNREKFQFDFLILGHETPCFYNEFVSLGCNFYFVTKRSKNLVKNRKEIRALFAKEKFDLFHCHLNSLSYLEPAIIAKELHIPTIITSHNAGFKGSFISKLLHFINRKKVLENGYKLLAVSQKAGEWMFGKTTNFDVINIGIDIEKYKFHKVSRLNKRKEFALKDDELVIVHTGAFRIQKNHSFIIDIFNELSSYNSNYKLILVGEGELMNEIKNKVRGLGLEDKVIFTGLRNDIPEILSASDIFLFPSFYEGFPTSVIEAQASGLPIFISSSITEEVSIIDHCNQLPIENNINEWVKNIRTISRYNEEERVRASEVIYEKGFSREKEIQKIHETYLEVLKS